jgi:hypothetical protein
MKYSAVLALALTLAALCAFAQSSIPVTADNFTRVEGSAAGELISLGRFRTSHVLGRADDRFAQK